LWCETDGRYDVIPPNSHFECTAEMSYTMVTQRIYETFQKNRYFKLYYNSSVSIVTRLQYGQPGFDSRQGLGFLFATASRPALWPTDPPIQSLRGASSAYENRPGREDGCSPPSGAEVKNTWCYASTPHMRLHGVVLKHRENFTFEMNWPSTWITVLEKLTVTQLVKKFSAFSGTRRFITMFTTARHWPLS